jgi:hypothetical protein
VDEKALLEELKQLDATIQRVNDLADLKPIFYRLEEVGKQPLQDFECQLMLADVKQKLVNKGRMLKEMAGTSSGGPFEFRQTGSQPASTGGALKTPPPPPPMASPTHTGKMQLPTVQMPSTLPPPAAPAVGSGAPPPGAPAVPWKRAILLGGVGGAILAVAGIAVLVQMARKKNVAPPPPANTVSVDVVTTPPGAAVKVNGEVKCTAPCKADLAPGTYQFTALLEGYEPAVSSVSVVAGTPVSVNLALDPQSQTLRLLTELPGGKVTLDDKPAGDLQDGQLILDRLTPGVHNIRVAGPTGEASFTVTLGPAKAPEVGEGIRTRDVLAVLVSTFANQAKVYTSGTSKVVMDAKPQGDAGPKGLELKDYEPGVHELVVADKKMTESFGPAPMLTVFLKSDQNIGTLIVAADQEDAAVFVNDKEQKTKVKRGLFRMMMPPGPVKVRVAKDGFEPVAVASANIKKGEETRVEFKLKALPQVAKLELRGALPGTQVFLDGRAVGTVAPDGTLSAGGIQPGEHALELRREGFKAAQLRRAFRPNDTVTLSGADVQLVSAMGTLRLIKNPPEAQVSWRRADEQTAHPVTGTQLELPAGSYVVQARAAGYADRTQNVQLGSGETRTVDIQLQKVQTQPAAKAGTIADFDDPNRWRQDGNTYRLSGGARYVLYSITPARGVFSFTVQKTRASGAFGTNRKIKWVVNFRDDRNYSLFELDQKSLVVKDVVNGRSTEKGKYPHETKDNAFTVQIEIAPDRVLHRIKEGDDWTVLDSWAEPGKGFSEGKFGFVMEGGEIAISDFRFTPAR